MSIEDEVRKKLYAKEVQPSEKSWEPITNQAGWNKVATDQLRKGGSVENLEKLKKFTGDPNARVEISTSGEGPKTLAKATLVWDEKKRKEMEKGTTPTYLRRNGEERTIEHTITRDLYEVSYSEVEITTEKRLEVKADSPLSSKPSIEEGELVESFVNTLHDQKPTHVVSVELTGKVVRQVEEYSQFNVNHTEKPGGDW